MLSTLQCAELQPVGSRGSSESSLQIESSNEIFRYCYDSDRWPEEGRNLWC